MEYITVLLTCSCYHRRPKLRSPHSRDRFLLSLEETRQRYRFVVVGYVVMPEHFHLLITGPEVGTLSTVMLASPEDWRWSSYRFYRLDEPGPVRVNEGWGKILFTPRVA